MSRVATTILYDENPQGLRTVELDNWQGKAFVVPRASLKIFRQRPESTEQGGVYVLFGEGNKKPTAYIGQTDNIGGRLSEHDRSREEKEWNVALIFIGNLDSTSVRYLESMAVEFSKQAGRYEISNSTTPRGGRYNEAQGIKVEGFFERMKLVTGLLGFPIFDNPQASRDQQTYIFKDVRNEDGLGKGTLLSTGEFMVFKNSLSRIAERPGIHPGGESIKKKIVR